MPTQQEINLAAYKSGKKPEEIQRLLQEKQGNVPTQVVQPVYPTQGSGPDKGVTYGDLTKSGYTDKQIQDAYAKGTTLPGQGSSNFGSGQTTGPAPTIQPSEVTAPTGVSYGEANILPPSVTGFTTPKPTIATTDKPVIGTTPATSTPIGSVSSILGDMGAGDNFYNQYYQDQLATYNAPIDESAIRKQKESEFQSQIDAINAVYADKLRQERTTGQGRLGSGRAIQARSGLIGSDFGTAQTAGVQQLNREQEQLVENERLALVSQVLSGAQKSAADEIAAKRAAKEAGGREYLSYLSTVQTRKAQRTQDAAKKLLALGKSPQDISDEELKSAGISRSDLVTSYTDAQTALAQQSAKDSEERAKAQLEQQKTQAEIDKIAADINKLGAESSMYYEVGNQIFEKGTNNFVGYASKLGGARASGGGGGGGGVLGGVLAGYINPTGNASLDLQQVELPGKATEFSKKSYGFGTRMAEAEDSIKAIEKAYATSGTPSEFLQSNLPSFLQSAERQKFEQAKRNFVNAVLRNESGAVIADSEFKNADKQYFPQPGDTTEVLAQKAKNRDLVTSNMFSSAGKDARGNSIKDIYQVVKQQNTVPSVPTQTTTVTAPPVGKTSTGIGYTISFE